MNRTTQYSTLSFKYTGLSNLNVVGEDAFAVKLTFDIFTLLTALADAVSTVSDVSDAIAVTFATSAVAS